MRSRPRPIRVRFPGRFVAVVFVCRRRRRAAAAARARAVPINRAAANCLVTVPGTSATARAASCAEKPLGVVVVRLAVKQTTRAFLSRSRRRQRLLDGVRLAVLGFVPEPAETRTRGTRLQTRSRRRSKDAATAAKLARSVAAVCAPSSRAARARTPPPPRRASARPRPLSARTQPSTRPGTRRAGVTAVSDAF